MSLAIQCATPATLLPQKGTDTRQKVLSQGLFEYAAPVWLESRKHHLAPRTYTDYQNYIKALMPAFKHVSVMDITKELMNLYQSERVLKVCPESLNKELSIIVQMRTELHHPIDGYKPLPSSKNKQNVGRRLTPSEEAKLERVFRAAADNPNWATAALASLLSMKSGLGPGEMLSLQLRNCSLNPPAVEVPKRGAKRVSRERYIELSPTAGWALERLIRLAKSHGASQPDDYLFPFRRVDHTYDPTRPAKGYREGLRSLFAIAELKDFRRYDFRHHAVSVGLSNPRVPLKAAKDYFGWVSEKMIKRYAHMNLETMRVVAAALENK